MLSSVSRCWRSACLVERCLSSFSFLSLRYMRPISHANKTSKRAESRTSAIVQPCWIYRGPGGSGLQVGGGNADVSTVHLGTSTVQQLSTVCRIYPPRQYTVVHATVYVLYVACRPSYTPTQHRLCSVRRVPSMATPRASLAVARILETSHSLVHFTSTIG